jgi:general secretion pathway protein F
LARFEYKAIAPGGEVVTGEISADSRDLALGNLERRGVVPLSIRSVGTARRPLRDWFPFLRRRKVSTMDLVILTRELTILLGAGIPLERALSILDRTVGPGPVADVPGRLLASIRGGSSLTEAVLKEPAVFPAFFAGMVRAGEAGGNLSEVLERLTQMLERAEALTSRIRSAMIYPMLVLGLTCLSMAVMLVYVIPEFRPILESADTAPPLTARMVLAASNFAVNWGGYALMGLLLVLLSLQRLKLSPRNRVRFDAWLLDLPMIGELLRRIETVRFCRTLGTLRANGVAMIEAVSTAAGTMSNHAFVAAARGLSEQLARGAGLTEPMRRLGLFPPLAVQLVEVGEESGELSKMLLQVADMFDQEAERTIQRLLALLTPVVTIVLGCLIAFTIGSILSAVLGTYDVAL